MAVPDAPWLIGRKVGETAAQIPEFINERVTTVLADWLPEVPLMVIGMSSTWLKLGDSVKTAVSLALRTSILALDAGSSLHEAVTPSGNEEVMARSTFPPKPAYLTTSMVVAIDNPRWSCNAPGDGNMANPGALMASVKSVVALKEPEMPVTVTGYDPRPVALLTVSVSTLFPLVGFVPHAGVTPPGRPDTARLTLPLNPPRPVTAMVVVPELPGLIDRLVTDVEIWKPADAGGAKASIKACPVGLPHPVTRS